MPWEGEVHWWVVNFYKLLHIWLSDRVYVRCWTCVQNLHYISFPVGRKNRPQAEKLFVLLLVWNACVRVRIFNSWVNKPWMQTQATGLFEFFYWKKAISNDSGSSGWSHSGQDQRRLIHDGAGYRLNEADWNEWWRWCCKAKVDGKDEYKWAQKKSWDLRWY